jgi:transposase-like protein
MWIDKYTQEAIDCFHDYRPKVGDTWIADETVLRIDGANVWLYDIIDSDTRFMLASRIATARTINDARSLMEQAAKVAGKNPKVVITDRNNSYLDGIELAYGSDTEHRLGNPFTLVKDDNTNLIERFHGTLKSRTKTMRGLKSLSTAQQFADGYLAYYNFLRPHESLENQTPASVAGIDYPVRTWEAVTLAAEPQVEVLTVPAKTIIVSEQVPIVRPILRRHYKADKGKKRLRHRKPAWQASVMVMRRKG